MSKLPKAPPAETPADPSKSLRIAFIGAGGIAGSHMAALAQNPRVQIVAMADPRASTMARWAEKYPIAQSFTDHREMLRTVKPDAVSVCTPNSLHFRPTLDALAAGAHVLVEKPMAMNAREAQAMLAAARKHRRKLCIGFQYRFDPRATFVRRAAEQGHFGKVLYARAQALRRLAIPNWGVFGRKELQGGGPMIDMGVHILEVVHLIMGAPKPVAAVASCFTYRGNKPTSTVSVWPNWDYKTYNVEDLAVGQVRFDNGAVLTIESSFAAHIDKDIFNFQIMGEEGGAIFDPPTLYHDKADHLVNSVPTFLPPMGFDVNMKAKLDDFVAHVLDDAPTLIPGEHGVLIQQMLDALYASAARGKEVRIR